MQWVMRRPSVLLVVAVILVISVFFLNISYFSGMLLCKGDDIQLDVPILVNDPAEQSKLEVLLTQYEHKFIEKDKQIDKLTKQVAQLQVKLQGSDNSHPPMQLTGRALKIPVILFTYNRPEYLRETLNGLLAYLPEDVPVIVSQDDNDQRMSSLISEFPRVLHLKHYPRDPPEKRSAAELDSYYYISMHYKWGLTHVFDKLKSDAVIIIEDDMRIAPDFFSYFEATYPLLLSDPTLFCVSAWNDNGQAQFVKDSGRLYRSNFFPGLGWMMTKEIWNEFKGTWPGAYWDDWVREPPQRKGRDCIRPEINRVYTFGKIGSSQGQFYDKYLATIKLNDDNIDWSKRDLSYLYKDNYDAQLKELVKSAIEIREIGDIHEHRDSTLILYYNTESQFTSLADRVGIMSDHKAGIPRTGYGGTVGFWKDSNYVILANKNQVSV